MPALETFDYGGSPLKNDPQTHSPTDTAPPMNSVPQFDSRPEAMADVPGACELSLTRAVVQYRDVHEVDTPGGRIQDLGLALVLEGRYASSAEVLDLGSGDVKRLDLGHELVVVDWVYEPTLDHAAALLRERARGGEAGPLLRFANRVGLEVLDRTGYSPTTRPSLLRLGFRDLCRDLDLHEGTSIRLVLDGGRVVRVHMDYDANALLVRTPTGARDRRLEAALVEAFPERELRRLVPPSSAAAGGYQVRFVLPQSLDELREQMVEVRRGLVRLLGHFEPERVRAIRSHVATFGPRDTLARLRADGSATRAERLARSGLRGATVH